MNPLTDLKTNELPKFHLHPLQWFLISILVLTMVNNLDHLAHTYYSLIQQNEGYASDWIRWAISYSVVLVFDMGTLAFVLIGSRKESMVSALVIVFVNLIFFDLLWVCSAIYHELKANGLTDKAIKLINEFFAIIIFACTFGYTIHRFSVVFHEKAQGFKFLLGLKTQLKKYESIIKELSLTIESNIKASDTTINELSARYDTDIKASEMALQQKEDALNEIKEEYGELNDKYEKLQETCIQWESQYNKQMDDLLVCKISLVRNQDKLVVYEERKGLAMEINNKVIRDKMLDKIEADLKKEKNKKA